MDSHQKTLALSRERWGRFGTLFSSVLLVEYKYFYENLMGTVDSRAIILNLIFLVCVLQTGLILTKRGHVAGRG